jgi:hypothetical protein
MSERRVFYFGCWNRSGHGYWALGGSGLGLNVPPWGSSIDSKDMYPEGRQGVARLHHKDGWTALSMADRTVDSRRGSHSTFVIEGELDYDEALAAARAQFPRVFARLEQAGVEVVPESVPVSSSLGSDQRREEK